ncbi:MAG: hypothetical protein JXP34_07185 [Planctomycetes bacterium]|nr:hypothetical protein [Planctomycetota bacterium]
MLRTHSIALVFAAGMAILPAGLAATHKVTPGGSIQAAIDASAAGDTIRVAEGTYHERLTVAKPLAIEGGWNVTFLSQDPALRPTIIAGPDRAEVILFRLSGGNTVFDGFTIQRSESAPTVRSPNSAIRIVAVNAQISVLRVKIRDMGKAAAVPAGGAIGATLTRSRLEIGDCLLRENRASEGGAVRAEIPEGGNLVILDSTFTENLAGANGGALAVRAENGSTVEIARSRLEGNATVDGDGGALWIDAFDSRLDIRESSFEGNAADNAGGAILGTLQKMVFVLQDSTFSGNHAMEAGAVDLSLTHQGNAANVVEGSTFEGNVGAPPCARIAIAHAQLAATGNTFRGHGAVEPVYRGGGIQADLVEMAGLTLERNSFEGNEAGQGGALFAELGLDCTLRSNRDAYLGNAAEFRGGAVEVELHTFGTEATFTNALFSDNFASIQKDALYLSGDGEAIARVVHSTFGPSGVVRSAGAIRLLLLNSIFWTESATGRSLILGSTAALASVRSCDIWYDPGAGADPYVGTNGNFSSDPRFAGAPADYHLLVTSPCIDAGEANTYTAEDMDGNPRPLGTAFDVGADEVPRLWIAVLSDLVAFLRKEYLAGVKAKTIVSPEPAGELDRILDALEAGLAAATGGGTAQACLAGLSAADQALGDLGDAIAKYQGKGIDRTVAILLLAATHDAATEVDRLAARIREEGMPFGRGDANEDGRLDIADAIRTLEILFANRRTQCADAADVNDDGGLDIGDPIYLLNYSFKNGPAIPPPIVGTCDFDPTQDKGGNLGCQAYAGCR